MLKKILRFKEELKLNKLKFGLAGGLTASIFILLVELFLWIKIVPLYNSIMVDLYGVVEYSLVILSAISILFILLGFIIGFVLTWFFAWIYNRLLLVKMK